MSEWPQVALKDIFRIARGGSPRPIDRFITDDPNGINWIMIADASGSSKYITKTKKRIKPSGASRSRLVKPGDFLLTNSMSFGRPYILKISGCIHDGWLVLSPERDDVDQDYFYHLFGSDAVYAEFKKRAAGATVKNLNIDLVKNIRIPLPPITQQKRIASILDKAEELRELRRQALRELDAIAQSIFIEMFGGSIETSKNSVVSSLGSHLQFLTSGGRGWAKFYSTRGSRFIRSLDVRINYISSEDSVYVTPPDNAEAKRTRTSEGDILLTITGSQIGRIAPVSKDLDGAFISQHVAIIRPNTETINPFFLSFFLNLKSGGQRQIAKFQYGQTKPGLNFEQIKSFQIPIPPISLQEEFVRRIKAIEQLKTTHRESLAQLDALFASLQHRAFRGKL